jgi:hypothetical protein
MWNEAVVEGTATDVEVIKVCVKKKIDFFLILVNIYFVCFGFS